MKTEKKIRERFRDMLRGKKMMPEGRGMNIGYEFALRWVLDEEEHIAFDSNGNPMKVKNAH